MKQELVNQIIESLLALVLLVITGVLLPEIKKWIQSKTEDVVIRTTTNELLREVDTAVNYIEQTMVIQLKKDGKWNSDTQQEALNKAVDVVLANLSQKTTIYLQENTNNIVDTIKQYVESAVIIKK